jgi:hypothetical protein
MRKVTRLSGAAAALALTVLAATALGAGASMPIAGEWRLDERASRNIPDAMKGIDLKISMKGNELITQRFFEGAPVGDPLAVTVDAGPVEKELAKGQRGVIQAVWKAGGKMLEQVVKIRQANLVPITQTTLVSISSDGKVMTRVQTTDQPGVSGDRVLVYRRKE